MKKTAVFLSMVILVSAALIGCQNTESIIGTWTLTAVEQDGEPMDAVNLEATFGNMQLVFKADGLATAISLGGVVDATYIENDDTIEVSVGAFDAMVFAKINGTLVFEDGDEKLIFTK